MTNNLYPSNLDRAAWADRAIITFITETGCDHEDSLGDLLADLMHWADVRNFDFEAALSRARDHYRAELSEERERRICAKAIAKEMLDALEQAVQALNTAPRFRIPHLKTNSYKIAAICDKAIAKAKGGAA
jgi:hypothetical protein